MGKIETNERRSLIERRQFYYSLHLPERRKQKDRRKNQLKHTGAIIKTNKRKGLHSNIAYA